MADRDEPIDDDMSAYLDSELRGESKRRLELLVATDESVRQEVRRLHQTWDMLDFLDMPRASTEFTQATVKIATLGPMELIASSPAKRILSRWAFPVLLVSSFALGFAIFRFTPERDAEIIRELGFFEKLEDYRALGNLALLQELENQRINKIVKRSK